MIFYLYIIKIHIDVPRTNPDIPLYQNPIIQEVIIII